MIVGQREKIEAACHEVAETGGVRAEVKWSSLSFGVAAQIVAVGDDRFHVHEIKIAVDVLGDQLGCIIPSLEAELAHAARFNPLIVAVEPDIADEDDGHFIAFGGCHNASRGDAKQREGQRCEVEGWRGAGHRSYLVGKLWHWRGSGRAPSPRLSQSTSQRSWLRPKVAARRRFPM